ncbi:MAG: hypothetical protein IJ695_06805 [Butyrivibrio sp.]|nr:hypothetical protein [Butyrivibrio sp.]
MPENADGREYKWKKKQDKTVIDTTKKSEMIKEPEVNVVNIPVEEPPIFANEEQKLSYLEQKNKNVEGNLPRRAVSLFQGKESIIRNKGYSFVDKKGREQNASYNPSRSYMKPVLDSMKKLDDFFKEPVDVNKAETIQTAFLDAIDKCDKYLKSRTNPKSDEGKVRRAMVLGFYEQLKEESARFSGVVAEIEAGYRQDFAGKTWLDVLADVRTDKFVDGQDGVSIKKVEGGNTSELYVIEKNGEKKYFKKEEDDAEHLFANYFNSEQNSVAEERAKAKTDEEEEHAFFKDEVLRSIRFEVFTNDLLTDSIIANSKQEDLVGWLQENMLISPGAPLMEVKSEEDKAYFNRILKEGARLYLKRKAVETAKLPEDASLSKRNVAAYRIAKLLGVESLIVGAHMSEIEVNGKKVKGIIMDDAGGGNIKQLMNKNNLRKVNYSGSTIKGLLSLQILDVILGQVDRHDENFNTSILDGNLLGSVKGIDNDLCLGNLTYEEILEKGNQTQSSAKSIEKDGELMLPYVDYQFAQKISEFDVQLFTYNLADVMTESEISFLANRFKGVQKVLSNRLNYEKKQAGSGKKYQKKILRSDADWDVAVRDLRANKNNEDVSESLKWTRLDKMCL